MNKLFIYYGMVYISHSTFQSRHRRSAAKLSQTRLPYLYLPLQLLAVYCNVLCSIPVKFVLTSNHFQA